MHTESLSCLTPYLPLCSTAIIRAQPMIASRWHVRSYSQSLDLPRTVKSLHEMMKLWDDFKKKNPIIDTNLFDDHKVPYLYGYGFRGLKSINYQLIPSAFRNSDSKVYEQSIYYAFRLLITEPQKDHRSPFDWLTLMQHYDAPTRLLDWSESFLKAMFFVVEDPPQNSDFKNSDSEAKEKSDDGLIWVLNSYKLNRLTSILKTVTGVGIPDTLNTVIRAEMTTTQDLRTLLRKRNILDLNAYDLPNEDSLQTIFDRVLKREPPLTDNSVTYDEFIHRLHSPFAVQSYRLNERIKLQNGFFTIFGGKASSPKQSQNKEDWDIGKYKSLEDLNDDLKPEDKFMVKLCVIPAKSKNRIHDELFELGINRATVYGDIPNTSKYVKELVNRFKLANQAELESTIAKDLKVTRGHLQDLHDPAV